MKVAIILATVIAAVAVGACRREVEHTPMKLGADVPAQTQVARSASSKIPERKLRVTF